MKRNLIIIGSLLMIFAMMAGCASGEKVQERRDLPEWFLSPPVSEDVIYGLGMAKMSSDSLSRDTGIARARKDVALQVSTRVQSMMTDYAQESGTGDAAQVLTFVESITKQVADVELQGAVTEKVYAAVDGTWFAMVSYPKNSMLDNVEDVFVRNEEAAYSEFKADQALQKLEASLNDNPTKSEASAE